MTANNTVPSDATGLKFHELANIFPMPDASKLGELAQDIRNHGLLDPIVLHEGKVLDGRSRYLACGIAGVEPSVEEFTGDDALALVVSRNLHRRHLNESQRSMAAAKFASLTVGANQHSEGMPIGRTAELMNVSSRSVARANEVLNSGDAELVTAVETGEMSVSAAAAKAKAAKKHSAPDDRHDTDRTDASGDADATPPIEAGNDDHSEPPTRRAPSSMGQHPSCEDILTPGVTFIVGGTNSAIAQAAVKIAATATAGGRWPDFGRSKPIPVVWLTARAGTRHGLYLQFEAARAERHNVTFKEPTYDNFDMPVRDLATDLIGLKNRTSDGPVCVVIDYISDYFWHGSKFDAITSRLRQAIAFMTKIADEKKIAFIVPCELPTRRDLDVVNVMKRLRSNPGVSAWQVKQASTANRGALLIGAKGEQPQFTFQLRQFGGQPAVDWDSLAQARDKAAGRMFDMFD